MSEAASLSALIKRAPKPHDGDASGRLMESAGAAFDALGARERALIEGAAGASPYLRRLMQKNPSLVLDILDNAPLRSLERACERARGAIALENEEAQLTQLRRAKDAAALSIALADIAGAWDDMATARAISDFADCALDAALVCAAMRNGQDPTTPGLGVIAMGKHGAQELNYSSDIDIVVIYDRARMGLSNGAAEREEAKKRAVKLTRDMVRALQMQTADGYVFRTDLRLRPDPGVTAVAISVEAAETYYEAFGQNWERMAYIKARAAAGDIETGEAFLKALRPFVWRKYLDYAAIDDVKAVKRQIHSAKGGGAIEFEGHDVKLGRGGIREIEFYVQTQQLILGGKDPSLRARATLDALAALNKAGHINDAAHHEMAEAYCYLRSVEHRLQMINDEQTHAIPKKAEEIDRLAAFLGEDSAADLREKLLATFRTVEKRFDDLFEEDAADQNKFGPLVFTGVSPDPATVETLKSLGFSRAEEIANTIRAWHTGALRATRTERARVLLTRLMGPLIEALSNAGNPDDAFFAFDDFLKRLPAGVQVFSLLASNVALFDTLIRIMTISPYLGRELSRHLNIIERLLDNSWASPPALKSYGPALAAQLAGIENYEDILNAVRHWAGEQRFLIAAQLAVGFTAPDDAARSFTAIADACIKALYPAALEEMRRQHGTIDGALVIAGMGRLGACEMTATSDIDLIFIYDAKADALSDGARPLGATEYFTRLVRRLVTALSAATEEGALYEVDMQLRPSGRAGPAAVSFSAFSRYYEKDAWTWEKMALTKTRVIAGEAGLGARVEKEVEKILRRPRDRAETAEDVTQMRRRLMAAKPAKGPWDVKQLLGGLTDISFLCQFLALTTAQQSGPAPRAMEDAISHFAHIGALDAKDASALEAARSVFEGVLQAGRATAGDRFDPQNAGQTARARIASLCGTQSIQEAEEILSLHCASVVRIYQRVLGTPLIDESAKA